MVKTIKIIGTERWEGGREGGREGRGGGLLSSVSPLRTEGGSSSNFRKLVDPKI